MDKYLKFKYIDEVQYNAIITAVNELNSVIGEYNKEIEKKLANPYNPIEYHYDKKMIDLHNLLNDNLTLLEKSREAYNLAINERAVLKEGLLMLNKQIAAYEIENDYEQYQKQFKAMQDEEEKLNELKLKKRDLEAELNKLQLTLKNTKIAMNDINNSLLYIFYSKERLVLEPREDGLYSLRVNGSFVAPSKVSTGERNAIALSYFFTELAREDKEDSMYKKPMLIVIDDPISSFDLGNRIGIMSLIKLKMETIFSGNQKTKCIIMTHDVSVMLGLGKCFKKKLNNNWFELDAKRSVVSFNRKNNEYNKAIKVVYSFANSSEDDDAHSDTIGNTMRKTLEAFSTFLYRSGIDEISADDYILEGLSDKQKNYFKSSMFRLILNGESHLEDNVKTNIESNFFSYLSFEEKRKTAKEILIFMYLLNKKHVLIQLTEKGSTKQNVKDNIQKWIFEIWK